MAADHDAIPTHVTRVRRVDRLRDRYVRVTFAGGLERFAPVAPDQFVYVLVPPSGQTTLAVDTSFRWTDYDALPDAVRPVGAYYTVRAFRPDAGELDCDFFLHEPKGPAATWASDARVDTPAALWGPRTTWQPPVGTTRWLLVADETGLPALESILESLPADADVVALCETDAAPQHLHPRIRRVTRNGAPAGTSDALVDAVRDCSLEPSGLYAWGGAESRAMRDVRRHLRNELGLDRERVSMTPYWRHASHVGEPTEDD